MAEPAANALQTITMLTASGQAGPSVDKGTNRKSTARINQAILDQALYANEIGFMVSPLLRTGVAVP